MDVFTKRRRSEIMGRVRSRGNRTTEIRVRLALIRLRIRGWKMHDCELPGKPDFVFPALRIALFVDGCFWHGCANCYRRPGSSRKYWDEKVLRNKRRDKQVSRQLRKLGWRVVRIKECALKNDASDVMQRVRKMLAAAIV